MIDVSTGAVQPPHPEEHLGHDFAYGFCGECKTPYLLADGHSHE